VRDEGGWSQGLAAEMKRHSLEHVQHGEPRMLVLRERKYQDDLQICDLD
jgi:hypothetical protein